MVPRAKFSVHGCRGGTYRPPPVRRHPGHSRRQYTGLRGRLSGAETPPALQLPPGVSGGLRPLRRHPGHADGSPLRDTWHLELRADHV